MKKGTKIIVASALIIGTAAAAFFGGYTYIKNRRVTLPEGFTLTAHTGCEGTEDNSLEAIKRGYESGADIVEFDLHFSKDGTPVLAHDGAEDANVTLDEAFALISELEGLRVNVDCKTTLNLKSVTEIADKHAVTERIFYTGIEGKDVADVKEQTPEVQYYINVDIDKSKNSDEGYLSELADRIIALGAVGINMHHSGCTKELVKVFHEKGLLVSVWTVNNEFDMIRALELCPDNITTRQPSRLNEIIKLKTGA